MRDNEDYSEPKYWTPFFLIGDDVTISVKEMRENEDHSIVNFKQ
jgi:hypothetical protein